MPKGKGPGAPYGNKNAAGPHHLTSVVKGGKLVRHPNPESIVRDFRPKIIRYATAIDRFVRSGDVDVQLKRLASAQESGKKQKASYGKFLKGLHKQNVLLKIGRKVKVRRQKRYRKFPWQ